MSFCWVCLVMWVGLIQVTCRTLGDWSLGQLLCGPPTLSAEQRGRSPLPVPSAHLVSHWLPWPNSQSLSAREAATSAAFLFSLLTPPSAVLEVLQHATFMWLGRALFLPAFLWLGPNWLEGLSFHKWWHQDLSPGGSETWRMPHLPSQPENVEELPVVPGAPATDLASCTHSTRPLTALPPLPPTVPFFWQARPKQAPQKPGHQSPCWCGGSGRSRSLGAPRVLTLLWSPPSEEMLKDPFLTANPSWEKAGLLGGGVGLRPFKPFSSTLPLVQSVRKVLPTRQPRGTVLVSLGGQVSGLVACRCCKKKKFSRIL